MEQLYKHRRQKIWGKKPPRNPNILSRPHTLHLTQPGEPADGGPAHYRRKGRCSDRSNVET